MPCASAIMSTKNNGFRRGLNTFTSTDLTKTADLNVFGSLQICSYYCQSKKNKFTRCLNAGFPLSCLQKIPGLFQDRQNVFPGLCRSPAMLHYKLTLYIQCNSTIHRKTFHTSFTETVRLAHSRKTSYIYYNVVFYT